LKDSYSGRTNFGVHKTDFIVFHQEKGQLAKFCSTGEQKAMLISIVLAQIDALKNNVKILPMVLFDELFVHLDKERREFLLEYLFQSNIQAFITATEIDNLITLNNDTQLIEVPR
jgi:DNA replication and repair protein RecF